MRALTLAIVVAGLAWCAFWAYSARALGAELDAWFEDRRSAGWEAQYDDRRIRGFPNRLDVTFEGLVLADPNTRLVWQAPLVQVLSLVYRRDHQIIAFGPEQVLTSPDGTWHITSERLRASVSAAPDGAIESVGLEADVLNISSDSGALAFAGLLGNLNAVEGASGRYGLALAADALASEPGRLPDIQPGRLDALRINAQLSLDGPLSRQNLYAPRPQPRRIDLRLAEYTANGLELKVAGALDIDDRGRADGKLTVKAVNWRDMLEAAKQAGRIGPAFAQRLAQGLGLVANLSGNRATLDLPLDFSRGSVSLGPIPLGNAPRLTLP